MSEHVIEVDRIEDRIEAGLLSLDNGGAVLEMNGPRDLLMVGPERYTEKLDGDGGEVSLNRAAVQRPEEATVLASIDHNDDEANGTVAQPPSLTYSEPPNDYKPEARTQAARSPWSTYSEPPDDNAIESLHLNELKMTRYAMERGKEQEHPISSAVSRKEAVVVNGAAVTVLSERDVAEVTVESEDEDDGGDRSLLAKTRAALARMRKIMEASMIFLHGPLDDSKLLLACTRGDARRVAECLEDGVSPDTVDNDGDSALQLACKFKHLNCVNLLLEAKASTEHRSARMERPLYLAIQNAQPAIVKALLSANASLESEPKCKGKASGDRKDRCLVSLASLGGDKADCLSLLLEAKASPDGDPKTRGKKNSWSPLCSAVVAGRPEVTRVLLEAGAKVDKSAYDGEKSVFEFVMQIVLMLSKSRRAGTVHLHLENDGGLREETEMVCASPMKGIAARVPSAALSFRMPACGLVSDAPQEKHQLSCLKLLIEAARRESEDSWGRGAAENEYAKHMWEAAGQGAGSVVRMLLEMDIDPEACAVMGNAKSTLSLAAPPLIQYARASQSRS